MVITGKEKPYLFWRNNLFFIPEVDLKHHRLQSFYWQDNKYNNKGVGYMMDSTSIDPHYQCTHIKEEVVVKDEMDIESYIQIERSDPDGTEFCNGMIQEVKVENQIKCEETIKIEDIIKKEYYEEEEFKVKLETTELDTNIGKDEFDYNRDQQLNEEFDIKDEDTLSDELSERAVKQKFSKKQHHADRKFIACYNCNCSVCCKYHLIRHMKKHEAQEDTCLLCNLKVKNRLCLIDHTMAEHPYNIIDECAVKADLANCKLIVCNHCNDIFTRKINLADHIVKKHPEFIDSVSDQIHECSHCTYKTTNRHRLTRHLLKHPQTASADGHKTCMHCNKTFTNSPSLNDHIIRQHPELIETVPSQIYECVYCTFKTVTQSILLKHLSTHPEADSSYKLKKCIHCNAQFKRKISLDAHIIKDHPEFIASVSRKIHKCIHCSYKSTYKQNLQRHLDKHQETVECQISVCIHCNATFKNSRSLDDHMVRKHPSSIASITRKIHKCTICSYKSIIKEHVRRHMLKHSEAGSICEVDTTVGDATLKTDDSLYNGTIIDHSVTSKIFECAHCTYKTNIKYFLTRHLLTHPEEAHRCVHCNATFKGKTSLYDHTIKKHSEMIDSVPGKIHECTHCTYKSTSKNLLTRHMKTHPGSPGYEINKCRHCHLRFKGKASLDEHIVRRHPEFIDSVSRNIHECKRCTFKTTLQSYFTKHMLKHAKADSLCMCIHCTETFKTKKGLDNHMVSTHPKSMNTDSVEVYYQCTFCTYKTTYRGNLARHCGIKHPERADAHEVIACIYCKATFKSKRGLEDHIVRKHPNIAVSVSKA